MKVMRATLIALSILLVLGGCQGRSKAPSAGSPGASRVADRTDAACENVRASSPLPGASAELAQADTWIARMDQPDEVLLSAGAIARLNASMQVPREGFHGRRDLLAAVDEAAVRSMIDARMRWLTARLTEGEYEAKTGFAEALAASPVSIAASLHQARDTVQLHCAPTTLAAWDAGNESLGIDRNHCSAAHAGELVQVLAPWPGGMRLARTAYSWGFIAGDAKLSAPLSAEAARAHAGEPVEAARPMTRRALTEEALALVGKPYGFGGTDGGLDCSRFLIEVFGRFGIELPRHSSWQAQAGTFSMDVGEMGTADKLALADVAAEAGAVLFHFPGHIMLYLGRDEGGTPRVVHALHHYREPCPGGERVVVVDRVQVSGLELGEGTKKGSLGDRIDTITVLGAPAGPRLAGMARQRPPAPVTLPSKRACQRASDERLFVSPAVPRAEQPVRVVATFAEAPRPVSITLFDPDGSAHTPEPVTTGGPPFGAIATVEAPAAGTWTVAVGEGETLVACTRVRVARQAARQTQNTDRVWDLTRSWTPAMEDLFSVFVERLFDYPPDEDITWTDLHSITRDASRNILFEHRGLGEEAALELVPDCADLPYTLRAYFAWKLGLPYGMHGCGRAAQGRPPRCERAEDNLASRQRTGDLAAFDHFVNRVVRNTVHSSSARTSPLAEDTDFYPVPLSREALRPGTLFADPYGHLIVVVDWLPQGPAGYGALVGADAQPDGTVGRRRFWRGSFLFHPDTESGGAGFKAFRPWSVNGEALVPATNAELRQRARTPLSSEQYDMTQADFYDRMQALINPRPLDPTLRMASLVEALEEQVARRATSVATGEAFMAERRYEPIDMPEGSSIFLTTGPWEDFSTPSRDWRLLIAMDTVIDFPDAVRRSPGQYGIAPADVDEAVVTLRGDLTDRLGNLKLTYTRSDGSPWELTLAEVLARREAFEMAYNPNDCIEIRWAAPEGSGERATCKRHAPAEQRARMQAYRPWFADRSRPAR